MVVLIDGQNIIRITVSPEVVAVVVENTAVEGFSDQPLGLKIPPHNEEIVFNVSYDGESEILAEIIVIPDGVAHNEAEFYLKKFFGLRETEGD